MDEYAIACISEVLRLSVCREAACSTGYSPLINFQVEDLDSVIPQLLMHGAELDGPIKYPRHGKVAVLRSPDGHMVGISELLPDQPGTDGEHETGQGT